MDRADVFALVIALIVWAIPLWAFYSTNLPPDAKIATHWGINGQPNGWTSAKDFPAVIGLLAGVTLLVWGIRFVYPRQSNMKRFARAYNAFVLGLAAILALTMTAAVLQAAGYPIQSESVVMFGVGTSLILGGVVTFVSKQNWAVGIRTPWGLESERAWTVSNRIGGLSLMLGGVLVALEGLKVHTAIAGLFVVLIGIVASAIAAYVVWRREQ